MNVYKQYLEIKSLQEINIPISNETDIVRLGISEDKPCVWFVAKECCNKNIAIHSYMTGEKIPDDLELNYLGSYMLNSQILIHVFSEIK